MTEEQGTTTKLDYGYGAPLIPDSIFKISPSGVKDFGGASKQETTINDASARPHLWFRQQFMNEDKFEGNNASIRGTIVHYLAQQYVINSKVDQDDYSEISKYLNKETERIELLDIEPIDMSHIVETYPDMWVAAREWIDNNKPDQAEFYVSTNLSENVLVQGQVDYTRTFKEHELEPDNMYQPVVGSTIVGDYKTFGEKAMKKSIEYPHLLQAYVYAYCMKENGENIGGIEITYIKDKQGGEPGKRPNTTLKLYPAEAKSFVRQYTDETHEFIGSYLSMVAETMEYFFKNPDLANILFKDQRLKGRNFTKQVQRFKTLNILDI